MIPKITQNDLEIHMLNCTKKTLIKTHTKYVI